MSEMDPSLQAVEARCQALLAGHVEQLPLGDRTRLARARAHALDNDLSTHGARVYRVPGVWLPAGVLSVAAALSLAVWLSRPAAVVPVAETAAVEDVELLAGDEPEMYAEDAAFYEWAGNASGAG